MERIVENESREIHQLHHWFAQYQRDFPWRKNRTPYKVWVSEIMLQQTRASVVIPYFERWLILFPDIDTLAKAPLEQVIKAWEGLGYYSRARNMHRAAQVVVEQFSGQIPDRKCDLEMLPGFGPYTVGAVLSFGFCQKAPAIDANVTRVIARLFGIEENVCKQRAKQKIEQCLFSLLDQNEPWVTMESFIELGATVCMQSPKCELCPLQKQCIGFQNDRAPYLPIKNSKKETIHLHRTCLVITVGQNVLLKKNKKGELMADLYEFPYFENAQSLSRFKQQLNLTTLATLQTVTHTFTHYKAHLYPLRFAADAMIQIPGFEWVSLDHLNNLPFSSGHKKILKQCTFYT